MSEMLLEARDGPVAVLTLNRPERLNALNVDLHRQLTAALDRVAGDPTCRAVVLTGAGRAFSTGQDLSERLVSEGAPPPDLAHSIEARYTPLVMRLRNLPKPLVIAVNGIAAGAGASLALHGDITIAARSAHFIQSFAKVGLMPDCGGTWLLTRLIGGARARGLAMLAEPLPAEEAATMGLIWRAVPDDELMTHALAIARKLAAGAPRALLATREAVASAHSNTLAEQLALERDLQGRLGSEPDYREGVRAFVEKREPNFTGAPAPTAPGGEPPAAEPGPATGA
ncbi:MAG: 2-(1,2-epoxy-1,2-dihydrophenyl)acetyl-CoA isomerase [Rhizobiales bacterium]|nr:2-(1,2-epoxy-1,2-dihydrophenyl)acetyl-CoA isomerase [Hyphomicrobiales bacterium]